MASSAPEALRQLKLREQKNELTWVMVVPHQFQKQEQEHSYQHIVICSEQYKAIIPVGA
jgi:hypothetical protein